MLSVGVNLAPDDGIVYQKYVIVTNDYKRSEELGKTKIPQYNTLFTDARHDIQFLKLKLIFIAFLKIYVSKFIKNLPWKDRIKIIQSHSVIVPRNRIPRDFNSHPLQGPSKIHKRVLSRDPLSI